MKRRRREAWTTRDAIELGNQYAVVVEAARVHGANAAELAARRLCLAAERGGVCHLDAGHKPPHLARTPEKTERPDGTIIRTIVEWR